MTKAQGDIFKILIFTIIKELQKHKKHKNVAFFLK